MSKLDDSVKRMLDSIGKLNKTPVSLIPGFGWGTVVTTNPISIKVETGQILDSNFIERSPFCSEWKTKRLEHLHKYNVGHYHLYDDNDTGLESGGSRTDVPTSTEMESDRETQKEIPEFTFWRGLQVGDKVCYLRINDSQKYILLWRENQFDLEV